MRSSKFVRIALCRRQVRRHRLIRCRRRAQLLPQPRRLALQLLLTAAQALHLCTRGRQLLPQPRQRGCLCCLGLGGAQLCAGLSQLAFHLRALRCLRFCAAAGLPQLLLQLRHTGEDPG